MPGMSRTLRNAAGGTTLAALARAWLLSCKCRWLEPQGRWLERAGVNRGAATLGRHRKETEEQRLSNGLCLSSRWAGSS